MIRFDPKEVLLYALASAASFAVDVGVLFVLAYGVGIHYLIAASISFAGGALVAYQLSIRCVFAMRRGYQPMHEFGIFVAIGILGLATNAAVMLFAVDTLHASLLGAKCSAAAITFAVNFTLRKALLFTAKPT